MADRSQSSMVGETYRVDGILFVFQREHPENPSAGKLAGVPIELSKSASGYAAPRGDDSDVQTSVANIGDSAGSRLTGGAIQHIATSVLTYLNESGLAGVWVGAHPGDIDPQTGEDLRPGKSGNLRLLVQTAVIGKVRTLARGERVPTGDSVNNPAYDWMLEGSPVKPGASWADSALLNRDKIGDYARWLSRHPGRRVDIAVSPIQDEPGAVALDYIVQEQKPVSVWAQATNTGTEQTADWRGSFGLQNNQFTGNDDQIELFYSSAGMDSTQNLSARYEAPLMNNRNVRVRINGGWNKYTASDVGFGELDFKGKGYNIGLSGVHNIRQRGSLFVDLVYGLSLENTTVDNQVVGREGEGEFLFPMIGLEWERYTRFGNTIGGVSLRHNVLDIEQDDLDALGRTLAEDKFTILSWYFSHNFYVDRILDKEATSLAHEIAISLGGQTSFGSRTPPNYQKTIGGMYTVRGYPESVIAGDNVAHGSIEYKMHIPQLMGVSQDPGTGPIFGGPFRYLPQYPYGVTDWDLALKGFIDVGYAGAADKLDFEFDETLVGGGIGFELRYRRNFFVSVDWGVAMKDTKYPAVTDGSSRVSISATVMY
ncbi:MAG: ShlB/FhaC/HecB family hemolysin secretion/activation protein [Puniceicoccaceae bacterium]